MVSEQAGYIADLFIYSFIYIYTHILSFFLFSQVVSEQSGYIAELERHVRELERQLGFRVNPEDLPSRRSPASPPVSSPPLDLAPHRPYCRADVNPEGVGVNPR